MRAKVFGIIPARYASTRFPGKPLVDIQGKSMINRVYEQCKKSSLLHEVIVATDDQRIYDHVAQFGGNVVMTGEHHTSGTSRIGEVVAALKEIDFENDIVINLQGDEPFINPSQIDELIGLFLNPDVKIATLINPISDIEDVFNPNVVKVVCDNHGKALYFSRSPIPYVRGYDKDLWLENQKFYRHIGLYAFKATILLQILNLPISTIEISESLEQLRWLYHGFTIHTLITDIQTIGIDTPEDLRKLTNKS